MTPRWQRVTLATCAAVIAYLLAYIGTDYARLPRLTYDQLRHEWRLAAPAGGLPSGYVGQWTWALVAGGLGFAVAYGALRWRRAPLSERALGLALAWTATAVLLALGYFTWMNWP